ncbi:hypothetical protein EK904_007220 [Melospiza melodia maxima]|nr:hypothetical protein EK904_007220 [Melospiza melodia maxima]
MIYCKSAHHLTNTEKMTQACPEEFTIPLQQIQKNSVDRKRHLSDIRVEEITFNSETEVEIMLASTQSTNSALGH